MSGRLDTLRSMVEQDPDNARVRYMLAIELVNAQQWQDGWGEFQAVLEKDANYGAAYFHGGQTLEKLGRIDEARDLYRRGIEAAGRSGDAHTQSELQGALDLLG